ncbi:MurR/RpiR family transcriptional regulator [uncultured Megasphaera sp.]|uniref:MurR/RpiR family transcriptional regulator n=1 Tax=uncultured Megasphaera sp. TaxID=165188 RepID=UPI00259A3B8A|nr:MurR/RpiR family transcriptional regulator [uncultured Megasphaera sp.]
MSTLYVKLSTTTIEMPPDSIEHHIARIMLKNINKLYELSINELAILCTVSKSTLSKFVRFLGFEDYQDFRGEAYKQRYKEVYVNGKYTMNITDFVCRQGMDEYIKILYEDMRNLLHNLDYKQIEKLITLIHDSEEVAAFGEVYSQTAALNFQYKMSFYKKFVYTTLNDQKQDEYIKKASSDTLLIIFSNSGRYIKVNHQLEQELQKKSFEQTGAHVALFTSNQSMLNDPRVDTCITWNYAESVQNHPFLYQLLIEEIAYLYKMKYYAEIEN